MSGAADYLFKPYRMVFGTLSRIKAATRMNERLGRVLIGDLGGVVDESGRARFREAIRAIAKLLSWVGVPLVLYRAGTDGWLPDVRGVLVEIVEHLPPSTVVVQLSDAATTGFPVRMQLAWESLGALALDEDL